MTVDLAEPRSSQTLFLPDSDDEKLAFEVKKERRSSYFSEASEDDPIPPPPRSSSPPMDHDDFNVNKKRKMELKSETLNEYDESGRMIPDNTPWTIEDILASDNAGKRRKIDTPPAPMPTHENNSIDTSSKAGAFKEAYLGEFIIPDAYTTLSGRGHIACGDEVRIVRDAFTSGKGKKSSGTSSNSGKGGAMKQGKLNFGPTATSGSKKAGGKDKENVIIRFENRSRTGELSTNRVTRMMDKKTSEIGRLPQQHSSWISKLLDLGRIRAGMNCQAR